MPNTENLRPFHMLPPEEHRELSRRGGIASGERRREIAEIRSKAKLYAAAAALIDESREEYRAAIKRYVKDERKKAGRRKHDELESRGHKQAERVPGAETSS